MNYPQHGSIATVDIENCTSLLTATIKITSTEAYDLESIFKKLSCRINKLEGQQSGTMEDLDSLKNDLGFLPRFSEERLECDIRVQSLKKKWGLVKKPVLTPKADISFPVSQNNFDNVLLEKSHIEYINSGKAGRIWIKAYLKDTGITVAETEEQLYELVEAAIKALYTSIDETRVATTVSMWIGSLDKVGIKVNNSQVNELFKLWTLSNKNKINTINQIQKWFSTHEEKILQEQKAMNIINSSMLEKIGIQ